MYLFQSVHIYLSIYLFPFVTSQRLINNSILPKVSCFANDQLKFSISTLLTFLISHTFSTHKMNVPGKTIFIYFFVKEQRAQSLFSFHSDYDCPANHIQPFHTSSAEAIKVRFF